MQQQRTNKGTNKERSQGTQVTFKQGNYATYTWLSLHANKIYHGKIGKNKFNTYTTLFTCGILLSTKHTKADEKTPCEFDYKMT